MTFPTINYKATNTELQSELQQLLKAKFTSLEKYLTHAGNVRCEVEFEQAAPQQSGKIFRVEANLTVDGTLHRAEATEEQFEKAIDEVRAELDKALRRSNKKRNSLFKRGGRKLKQMMQFGK